MTFADFVKRQDLFAVPVQLTYKGERGFSSCIGGCCSIIFVLTAVALFAYYSLQFHRDPQFSTSESVSYITYSTHNDVYSLEAKRNSMVGSMLKTTEDILRVRFYQMPDSTPIQAVYCKEFFKEQIAAELAQIGQSEETYIFGNPDLWYAETFLNPSASWVCPNTTTFDL